MMGSSPVEFTILPAIDLLDGQSVRLRKGERQSAEVVHSNPVEQILGYAKAGARWAHIVNLNAAFGDAAESEGRGKTEQVLRELLPYSDRLQLQVGGGVRCPEDAERLFACGVQRVVVGTFAMQNPDEVCVLAQQYPGRVVVGLDALHGKLVANGWTELQDTLNLYEFARQLKRNGVSHALYTQIEHDGMLAGVSTNDMVKLAQESGLLIIASGGVASEDDIRNLRDHAHQGVCGVVVGKALHTGSVQLERAIRISLQNPKEGAPSRP